MDCHATAQNPVNNRLQSLYHLLKALLNNTNNYLTKIVLQLALFTVKFFHELRNKHVIVHKGTDYPSNCNPMGVAISE